MLLEACDPFETVRTELRFLGLRAPDLGMAGSCLRAEVFVGLIYDGTGLFKTPLSTGAA